MEKYIKHYQDIDNGESIAYVKEGSGKSKLLLIHGNYCSSLHWSELIARLKNDFTIYAVDLRGFGDSSYNHEFNSLADLADDVALFCEKQNLTNITVAGWSLGGGVVMALAARHPKIVKKMILIDSMSYRGYPMFVTGLHGQPVVGSVFTSKNLMANDPVQVKPLIRAIRGRNFPATNIFMNMLIYTGKRSPTYTESLYYISESFKQRCVVDALWSMANFNMSDLPTLYSAGDGSAKQVKCPIISFWGVKDKMVPYSMATENCVGFPQLEFVVVHDSGHAPILDNPDYMAVEIKKWIIGE